MSFGHSVSHLRYGEHMALQCAQRLQQGMTPLHKICALQIIDETRHVRFSKGFLKRYHKTKIITNSNIAPNTSYKVYQSPTVELLLISMHIITEKHSTHTISTRTRCS